MHPTRSVLRKIPLMLHICSDGNNTTLNDFKWLGKMLALFEEQVWMDLLTEYSSILGPASLTLWCRLSLWA